MINDKCLVWAFSNVVPRRIIEANGQASLFLHTRRSSAPELKRLSPHNLRVDAAPVVGDARVVGVVVELLLLHPLLNRHARRHRRAPCQELVRAVLAGAQVRELAPQFVPLVPRQLARHVRQLLAPPQRFHPHRRPRLVVRLQELSSLRGELRCQGRSFRLR